MVTGDEGQDRVGSASSEGNKNTNTVGTLFAKIKAYTINFKLAFPKVAGGWDIYLKWAICETMVLPHSKNGSMYIIPRVCSL